MSRPDVRRVLIDGETYQHVGDFRDWLVAYAAEPTTSNTVRGVLTALAADLADLQEGEKP